MASRKRNLEKVERISKAPTMDAPAEPRGHAAKYLRDLIAKAERGELKMKPATDEKRSRTWLEAEVEKVANRLNHRAQSEGASGTRHDPGGERAAANHTGADEEPPEELLSKLLRKLVSDKVH